MKGIKKIVKARVKGVIELMPMVKPLTLYDIKYLLDKDEVDGRL